MTDQTEERKDGGTGTLEDLRKVSAALRKNRKKPDENGNYVFYVPDDEEDMIDQTEERKDELGERGYIKGDLRPKCMVLHDEWLEKISGVVEELSDDFENPMIPVSEEYVSAHMKDIKDIP